LVLFLKRLLREDIQKMDTKNQEWLEKGLGKQLLLKMGWKEGTGLGIEGQGRVSNVKVVKQLEQRGLGFNTKQHIEDSASVKQIQDLSDVLRSLQEPMERAAQSTESETRKKKKTRVKIDEVEEEEVIKPVIKSRRHRGYKKFLEAKDVSRYSQTDLQAILGGINPSVSSADLNGQD
jgi:hypothetical protein